MKKPFLILLTIIFSTVCGYAAMYEVKPNTPLDTIAAGMAVPAGTVRKEGER